MAVGLLCSYGMVWYVASCQPAVSIDVDSMAAKRGRPARSLASTCQVISVCTFGNPKVKGKLATKAKKFCKFKMASDDY
jgi:hypothetical protein